MKRQSSLAPTRLFPLGRGRCKVEHADPLCHDGSQHNGQVCWIGDQQISPLKISGQTESLQMGHQQNRPHPRPLEERGTVQADFKDERTVSQITQALSPSPTAAVLGRLHQPLSLDSSTKPCANFPLLRCMHKRVTKIRSRTSQSLQCSSIDSPGL